MATQRTSRPTRGQTDREAGYLTRLLGRIGRAPSGCWPWLGTLTWGGYGQIGRHGQNVTAHRAVWEHFVGPIPEDLTLGHRCHDEDLTCPPGPCEHRRCVNPTHLYLQTRSEQMTARLAHAAAM
ncbi:MAG: HNH endonuclease [Micrococcales bacterium]|nr:HNH endonuclease [Micrococcales bacterium]